MDALQAQPTASVWAQDEARFGLKTWHRRCWYARGTRPVWKAQQVYQWVYVYGVVEPLTGRSVFALLPDLRSETVQVFLQHVAREVREPLCVVWDGVPGHQAAAAHAPESIQLVRLPPYSPELNPIEQVWRIVRKRLANRIFADLDELEAALTEALQEFWDHPAVLIRLTAYPWWRHQVETLHA